MKIVYNSKDRTKQNMADHAEPMSPGATSVLNGQHLSAGGSLHLPASAPRVQGRGWPCAAAALQGAPGPLLRKPEPGDARGPGALECNRKRRFLEGMGLREEGLTGGSD